MRLTVSEVVVHGWRSLAEWHGRGKVLSLAVGAQRGLENTQREKKRWGPKSQWAFPAASTLRVYSVISGLDNGLMCRGAL